MRAVRGHQNEADALRLLAELISTRLMEDRQNQFDVIVQVAETWHRRSALLPGGVGWGKSCHIADVTQTQTSG